MKKKQTTKKTLFFFDNPSLFSFWDTQSEEHLCFWDFRTTFYSIFVEYFVQVFFANLNSPRKEEGNFLFGRNFCHAKLTTKPSSYWKEKEYLWTAFLDLPRNSLTAQNITKKTCDHFFQTIAYFRGKLPQTHIRKKKRWLPWRTKFVSVS